MTQHTALIVEEGATELPRLMRPLPASAMPGPTVLAIYDPVQNLVIYNKDLFDQLSAAAQRATLRTQRTLVVSDVVDLNDFI